MNNSLADYRASLLLILASIATCGWGQCPAATFELKPPDTSKLKKVSIWATEYRVYFADEVADGVPLASPSGKKLAVLSKKDWCMAALEGTVRVGDKVFNYAEDSNTRQANCSEFFPHDVGFSLFNAAVGPFGDGVSGYMLAPYRTLATDPKVIPTSTVLFIPAAVGTELPGGHKHDGYFFAADRGGAIKGNHIDVFSGTAKEVFAFVTSKPTPEVDAYVVNEQGIAAQFSAIHQGCQGGEPCCGSSP